MSSIPDSAGFDRRLSLPEAASAGFGEKLPNDPGAIVGGTVLPFLLIFYLGLEGGGYDEIVRGEIGVLAWWIVLLGALLGILPTARISRSGYAFLGLLVAFTIWTGLGALWSESAGRSVAELSRVASLLGMFALALSIQGPGFLRRVVGAIGSAVVLITILALGSRFHPSWFPPNEVAAFLPSEQARLNYPLTYWNGLATLIAIGLPLLVWTASGARHLVARAAAVAAIPAVVLAGFFTLSRGGVGEAAVAVAVLIALHPRRLLLLPTLLLGAGGAAVLIVAASARNELSDGLLTPEAVDQGTEMILITLAVCTVAGLLAAALGVAGRREWVRTPTISRRTALRASAGAVLVAITAGAALGLPGKVSSGWEEFKQPVNPGSDSVRFSSVSGSGRYQWWRSAVDASANDPLIGIGPGTFEFWWARGDGGVPGFVRDAHSLYLETLGELGIVGMALILAFVGGILAIGISHTTRSRGDPRHAGLLAAGSAGAAAFAVAAAVDWAWELTVLPATFLLLGAALIGAGSAGEPDQRSSRQPARAVLAILALCSLLVIGIPLMGALAVERSQSQVNQRLLPEALESAARADDLEPYAATPNVQEALVLELGGDLVGAVEAAREATADEPTNWRTWLILSRIEAELGNTEAATEAYGKARSLNPRSYLFAS